MKRALFIAIALFLLTACLQAPQIHAEKGGDMVIEAYSPPYEQLTGLYIYVEAESVTPTGLRLSMVNNSPQEATHGAMFRIEQYLDGIWQSPPFINPDGWILALFSIWPGFAMEEEINWEWMHGELPPGQYRILREFNFDTYFYAPFTIAQDWQAAHAAWQAEQAALVAAAYARFDGLDLEILEHSSRGLSFTITNNNPDYTYIFDLIFVGWTDEFGGGHSSGMEYSFYRRPASFIWPNPNFAGPQDKVIRPTESLSFAMDWYYQRGELSPRLFDLVIRVVLNVDQEYFSENFSRRIPGVPGIGHEITAQFEIN
ncbi:MAG: hypothetical protein LBE35_03595 [Clostridiales bacterium]|nr:hypothetical protein [Clostridiales bacterium]